MLTAFQLPDVRKRWIADYGDALPAKERKSIEARLDAIAVDGFAAINSAVVPGVTDISAPVMQSGMAIAALTIPFMNRVGVPMSQPQAAAMAREKAEAIAQRI